MTAALLILPIVVGLAVFLACLWFAGDDPDEPPEWRGGWRL